MKASAKVEHSDVLPNVLFPQLKRVWQPHGLLPTDLVGASQGP